MKNIFKKIALLAGITTGIMIVFLSFSNPKVLAQTANFWTQNAANVLSTNTSGGLATADIHVAHCYIGTGTGTPCSAGGGGTIGGSIATNQIGYGSAANTLAGNANLTWVNSTGILSSFFAGNGTFLVDPTNQLYDLGGYTGGGLGNYLEINNAIAGNKITLNGSSGGRLLYDGVNGIYQFGDIDHTGSRTRLFMNDTTHILTLGDPTSFLHYNGGSGTHQWGLNTASATSNFDVARADSYTDGFTFTGVGLNDAVDTGTTWNQTYDDQIKATITGITFTDTSRVGIISNGDTINDVTSGATGTVASISGAVIQIAYTSTGDMYSLGDSLLDVTSGATSTIALVVQDKFKWTENGNQTSATTNITGGVATAVGINGTQFITWGASFGHSAGDFWVLQLLYTKNISVKDSGSAASLESGNSGTLSISGPLRLSGITTLAHGTDHYVTQSDSDIEFTGSTGTSHVYLLNTFVTPGTLITVCDQDLGAGANNIVIDAGTGNRIVGSAGTSTGTSSQTKTINTNGTCWGLKKVSSTLWKIQSAA